VARFSEPRTDGTAATSVVVSPPYPGLISAEAVISRGRPVARRLGVRTWTIALGSLIGASAVVRAVLAQRHTAPRYWPDEYVYAALSRSLAHGHLQVRGEPASFYAILQPIVAAPIWHFFPVQEAYRLIQVENAVAASLVVVPLWFLGRELRLSRPAIYLACAYALLVPTLAMIPVTISDFIAYPLVIAAVAIGVRSLNEPTRGRQLAFLCFAALATLARIQYFVLVPAYLAAALLLDRRRAHREHAWVFLALLPALGGAVLGVTGYYAVGLGSFRPSIVTWFLLQCFLLSLTAGVAIVPGAVAAVLRPSGRAERAFAAFASVFTILVLIEASKPAAEEGRYKERYLMAIVPLLAVAFGLHRRGNGRHRLIVPAVAAALMIAAPQLPVSGYSTNAPFFDSQTLNVAWLLQRHVGASTSSLIVLLFMTFAAAVAVLCAWRPRAGVVVLPLSIAFMLVVTVTAVHIDRTLNQKADDPAWIDVAAGGANVTAIATPSSPRLQLIRQLYWNASVDREVLLEGAEGSDSYAKQQLKVGPDGVLEGIHGYFLFDRTGTQATFAGATAKAHRDDYTLFEAPRPRLRVLVENQLSTGWLSPYSRLRAWPTGRANGSPVVRFTLSLPPEGTRRVHMQLGSQKFVVKSGSMLHLTCASARWPFKLLLLSNDIAPDELGRPVTVGLTGLSVTRGPARSGAAGCSATPN
jgi:Dolichyl-phosphate-mannose-protein mannosyltransferase